MNSALNSNQKLFVDLMTDDIIYTNEELARLCNVDVRTIYRWRRNERVTKEINKLADASLGQYIAQANQTLIGVMEEGSEHAKLKAIDMLFKSLGKYKDTTEVTIKEEKSLDERRDALLSMRNGNF